MQHSSITRCPRVVYIVLSVGEDSTKETIKSILTNVPRCPVIIHATSDVFDSIFSVFPSPLLFHSCEEVKLGIYNAMNDALRFLYSNPDFSNIDYFCFLNSGDCLPPSFSPILLLSTYFSSQEMLNSLPVVIFGHQSVLKSNRLEFDLTKFYLPPLHYGWHYVFRGGQFCHQASYFPLDICRSMQLYFDVSLGTFADLGFVIYLLRNDVLFKTFPFSSVIYDPKGFSSRKPLSTSINKFKYLCSLPELSQVYFFDLMVFVLKSCRRFLLAYIKRWF